MRRFGTLANFSTPRIITGMPMKYGLLGGALLALLVGAVVAVDILVVTDEERLEQFIDDVTGPVDRELVDRAMQYVDPERVPIDVRVLDHAGAYDAQRADELEQMFRDRMRRFYGDRFRTLTRRIEIENGRAHIRMMLLSQRGRQQVALELRKVDDKWLVAAVRIPG